MVSAQQAEIIVWVNMIQCEDQIYQSLPTARATVRESVVMQRYRATGCRLDCLLHSWHLEDSAKGPTGDFESCSGEQSASTSSSKFLQSFLSNPASLPAVLVPRSDTNQVSCTSLGGCRQYVTTGMPALHGSDRCLTRICFQVPMHIVFANVNVVQEGINPVVDKQSASLTGILGRTSIHAWSISRCAEDCVQAQIQDWVEMQK